MPCPKGASVGMPFLWCLSLGKQIKVLARLHWRLFEEANIKAGEKGLQRFLKTALKQACALFRPPYGQRFDSPGSQAGANCRPTNTYFVNTLSGNGAMLGKW